MKQENSQPLPMAGSPVGDHGSGINPRDPRMSHGEGEYPAARLLAIQRDFSIALLRSSSREESLELLLAAVLLLPECDGGGVYLRDDGDGVLKRIAYQGEAERVVGSVSCDPEAGNAPRFLCAGGVRGDLDAETPARIAATMIAENISAMAVIPLCEQGRRVATLGVFSNLHPQIGNNSRLVLESLTAQTETAIGLARVRSGRQAASLATELEAANTALRAESRRLEMALAASQAGTWSLIVKCETLEWDNHSRALFGFENDVPVSFAKAMARLHPECRDAFLENYHESVRPGGRDFWSQEFRIEHPTRGERWLAGLGNIERDESGNALKMSGINLDITRRKHSQKTLDASVAFATNLMRSMQDGFSVLNLDGVAVEANPAFCQMTGFSMDELVGAAPPHPYWPPEDYVRIQEVLDESANGNGSTFELTFMRKTGQRFPVIVSAFTVLNRNGDPISYAATVKDITGRKQAEEAMRGWNQTLERRVAVRTAELKQSEARFRQLVDATFEGVVISENGVVIDGNPQIAAMLGCDFPEMIGRRVTDFIAPESRDLVLKRISEGFEAPYEFTGLRLDGTKMPMEAHGRMMIWQGKNARVTALRDLTSKKLAEARIEAQKTELDQALRLALLSEVSAGIVHQIGQPLSAIGASLAAAVFRFKSGEVTSGESLQLIEETALNIARMRDSVIHLRALANPEQPNRVTTDFNGMVADTLHLMRAEADSLRFDLTLDPAPDLPPLRADTVQLSQVVINLVRNALDACADCPPERRTVLIRTRAIGDRQLELCVRDSGTGIAPAVMDHLYLPFFTTKPDGFGIGLRLSRTIINAHGGTIDGCNNSDGIGATFRVVLPLDTG